MALPNRAYTADYAHVGRAVQSGGQPRPGSAASIYRGQARTGGAASTYRGQARPGSAANAYRGQAYPAYAPDPERDRRSKEWKQRNITLQPQPAQTADTSILTHAMLAKTVAVLIFAGILLIATVFLTAKASEIKYSINSLTRQNTAIQKEIDVLQVKIGSASSIERIEQYATEELGMRYPTANHSIYLTVDCSRNADLVQRIKEKAYRA